MKFLVFFFFRPSEAGKGKGHKKKAGNEVMGPPLKKESSSKNDLTKSLEKLQKEKESEELKESIRQYLAKRGQKSKKR